MAKKMRKMMVLCMVLILCLSTMATTAFAKESNYEWYKVYVNGKLVASAQGGAGNDGWLVRGVYSWSVSVSGTTLSWRAGSHSGTVSLGNYITIPEGYEVNEDGYTVEHKKVEGTNSQSARFDNATITVTITALYDPVTEETIPVPTEPDPTEPEPTEPEPTEPEPTEPEPTEPEPTEPEPTEPEPTEPEPTEPEPTEPEPTEPEPTEPEPTEQEPTEPEPTEPEPTEPEPTEPEPTEPEPTEPEPTEPEPTEPEPTEPEPTEPEPTEPEPTEPEPTEPEPVPASETESDPIPEPEPAPASESRATPPKTGDISSLWAAAGVLSLGGIGLLNRKRKENKE